LNISLRPQSRTASPKCIYGLRRCWVGWDASKRARWRDKPTSNCGWKTSDGEPPD